MSLVVIVAICASAHYLQQIRDLLRDLRDAAKRPAAHPVTTPNR